MYEQQDIVLLPFPYSDLTAAKQRPALIVSNQKLNKEDRICCLITSKKTSEGLLVTQESLKQGKLPFTSWVKPHRIFTIHEKLIKRRLCTATKVFHKEVIQNLDEYLDSD